MTEIRFLSAKEVCKKLGISHATLYNWLKKMPDFPQPIKILRNSRWNSEEIDKFMNSAPRGVNRAGNKKTNEKK